MNPRDIKWVAFVVTYAVSVACLAKFAPDWADANTITMAGVAVGLGVSSIVIGYLNNRQCNRMVAEATSFHERGLVAWSHVLHGKYTTSELPTMPGLLELVCGCGDKIGTFWRDNPDAVLALGRRHVEVQVAALRFGTDTIVTSREKDDAK